MSTKKILASASVSLILLGSVPQQAQAITFNEIIDGISVVIRIFTACFSGNNHAPRPVMDDAEYHQRNAGYLRRHNSHEYNDYDQSSYLQAPSLQMHRHRSAGNFFPQE